MNSMIISAIVLFCRSIAEYFRNSGICAIMMKIYNFFSTAWKKSSIMTALRGNKREGEAEKSITGKILRIPFTVCEFVSKKLGAFINERVKQSAICRLAIVYIQNFMAVNTRFFGFMLLFLGIGFTAMKFVNGHYISRAGLIAGAVGALLCLMNFNLMGFLNPSKAADFIKACAGFRELDFGFYEEKETTGILRLVLAAFVGSVTGLVMGVMPLYGAVIPFAIFGMLLVMRFPTAGVYASVFFAPLVPTMVLVGLCLWTGMSLVLHAVSDEGFKWRFEGVGIGIMLLLIVLFISSVFSFAAVESLMVWAMYLVFAGFFFIIVNTIKTREQLWGLLRVFVISGAIVALYGVMQYVFGWTTTNAWIDEGMFEAETMRVYSTLANPNVLGEYLLLVLPVAAVWMLKDAWSRLSKWAYMAAFLVMALCLVFTQSRGCWIGFMICTVIFVTFYEGKWWGLLPIVLILLPIVVPETVVDRIASVGNMSDSSTSYRVYIWMGTFGMLKHYWLGGIGMGEAAFAQVYPFFSYNAIVAPHSHNTFLQLIVEAGVGALIVFLVIQFLFVHKMHGVYKKSKKKSVEATAALALASGVIAFLVQSLFDYTFYNYRVMCIFFMVLAMGVCLKFIKDGGKKAV